MSALIQHPEGYIPIPSATVSVSWVLMHPANENVEAANGAITNSREPLAYVNLGTLPLALDEQGKPWVPTLNDLTPEGRMVRDILIDNAILLGGQEILLHNVRSSVPGVVDQIAHALVN